ncbi:MAG: hypothetical protein IKT30_06860 [Bacteroidaceae bacterium]|nr:hypothetical protein [Bacteroidaceae bacterium]
MIKGKTTSGIKFNLDERIKDDSRLLYLLIQIQSDKVTIERKGALVFDMLNLVFGSDENVMAFMEEVASKHDGFCTNDTLLAELNEIFEALGAKNS